MAQVVGPASRVGDPDEVLAVATIWEVNQQMMEELTLSLLLSVSFSKKENFFMSFPV